jgi:hypothetical protein
MLKDMANTIEEGLFQEADQSWRGIGMPATKEPMAPIMAVQSGNEHIVADKEGGIKDASVKSVDVGGVQEGEGGGSDGMDAGPDAAGATRSSSGGEGSGAINENNASAMRVVIEAASVGLPPGWKAVWSDEAQREYYWCRQTNAVQWPRPLGYGSAPELTSKLTAQLTVVQQSNGAARAVAAAAASMIAASASALAAREGGGDALAASAAVAAAVEGAFAQKRAGRGPGRPPKKPTTTTMMHPIKTPEGTITEGVVGAAQTQADGDIMAAAAVGETDTHIQSDEEEKPFECEYECGFDGAVLFPLLQPTASPALHSNQSC